MRLTFIRIENFRCIDEIDISLKDYTTIIGPNNSGKSSIFHAIDILLSQKKPCISDWHQGTITSPIVIEGIFQDIQAWERNSPGVAGIIHDNKIRLRVTATAEETTDGISVTTEYEARITPETINGFGAWSELSDEIKALARNININNGNEFKPVNAKERLKAEIRQHLPHLITQGDPDWTAEGISIKAALQQALPKSILIPATSKLSDDLKTTGKSPFNQLLSQVVMPAIETSPEYLSLKAAIDTLSNRLSATGEDALTPVASLTQALTARLSSILDASVALTIETEEPSKFISSGATLKIDDGHETSPEYQGSGAQRALTFALLEELGKAENTATQNARSTILLFEEPELFIHPHLLRRLKSALISISNIDSWQVFSTTHSPFLIDVAEDPLSLILISRPARGTAPVKRQLTENPFINRDNGPEERQALRAALDFHPSVCEAFFAERVVLVEGDTEIAVFRSSRELLRIFDINTDLIDATTVVSCGGKWTIPAIARLLSSFGIPFRIIHDADINGRTAEQLNTVEPLDAYNANAKIRAAAGGVPIHLVHDTFEDLIWPGENSRHKDKPYKAWIRIKHLIEHPTDLTALTDLRDTLIFAFN